MRRLKHESMVPCAPPAGQSEPAGPGRAEQGTNKIQLTGRTTILSVGHSGTEKGEYLVQNTLRGRASRTYRLNGYGI